ncbi:uncharacterized protein LOC119606498 [Lucilia sericata]|uniref:uncharacterized protein LOC119606498 n=1 Tax=Lucilia sericata TaxID=13632 RepID=UPI0018A86E6A|nr:uncharacterized protein LOC119606498 [Lucilia sericata]
MLSISLMSPPTIESTEDIDAAVAELTEAFRSATNIACKPSAKRGKSKPPWWNLDIARARKECRKLFNEAKRSNNWSPYKSSVNYFKNMIRNAKRKAWRDFCSNVEGSSETNRLRKILSTTQAVPSYIQKPCGSWTTSSRESLEVLLDTHFPGCQPIEDNGIMTTLDHNTTNPSSVIINRERICWALNSFDPYKSPGPDGIIPADLQKNEDLYVDEV